MKRKFGRRFKKRGGFKRAFRPTVRKLAKKINRVAKIDRPEYHVFDDNLNDNTVSGNFGIQVGIGASYKYFGLPLGAGASTLNIFGTQGNQEGDSRGNHCRIVSFTIRGNIYLSPVLGTVDFNNVVRIIWLWDKEAAYFPTLATWSNNFPGNNNSPLGQYLGIAPQATQPTVYSGYNVSMVGRGKRFQVLSDKSYRLSSNGQSNKNINQKLRVRKDMGIPYALSSGAVITTNLLCMLISDSYIAPAPIVTFNIRACYTV